MDSLSPIKIGIIGAMDDEVAHLVGQMVHADEQSILGMTFVSGDLAGVPAIVVRSGMGKVNAGVCMGILATRYAVTHVINTGVAGAIDEGLGIGDLVVSTDVVQHDMDVRALGLELGSIPGMDTSAFVADPTLRALALEAATSVVPEVRHKEGRIVSGDQFVSDARTRARLAEDFGAACCEMEGAAIGQVAYLAGIPFVVVRVISDQANGASVDDYPAFMQEMALRSSRIVERMVNLM